MISGRLRRSSGIFIDIFSAQLRKANAIVIGMHPWCEALSSFSSTLVALRGRIPGSTSIHVWTYLSIEFEGKYVIIRVLSRITVLNYQKSFAEMIVTGEVDVRTSVPGDEMLKF